MQCLFKHVQFAQTIHAVRGRHAVDQRVVLIAFPHPGVKTIGLVMRTFRDDADGRELAAVFVPTTPNPTGGYLQILPLADLVPTDWSVDQAMAFVLSGGAVAPERITFERRGGPS